MRRAGAAWLLALAAGLWGLVELEGAARERAAAERSARSRFQRLREDGASSADVARLELRPPGAGRATTYLRTELGWRIPELRDAFALGRELEATIAAFLESEGTWAGSWPADEARYGLDRGFLWARLVDARGETLLEARAGRLAPGASRSECFLAASHRPEILQAVANPWAQIPAAARAGDPPLLDRRITPLALERRALLGVQTSGAEAGELAAVERRTLPPERLTALDRGPRFEWHGIFRDGSERLLDERSASLWVGALLQASWEELLGTFALPTELGPVALELVLRYDGGASDRILIGAPEADGRRRAWQETTRQLLILGTESARALQPGAAVGRPAGEEAARGR